jgi:hypothetical protein
MSPAQRPQCLKGRISPSFTFLSVLYNQSTSAHFWPISNQPHSLPIERIDSHYYVLFSNNYPMLYALCPLLILSVAQKMLIIVTVIRFRYSEANSLSNII